MDAYQQYIHKSRYARYLPEEQRRETWEETIDRYLNFWIVTGKHFRYFFVYTDQSTV